jgi:hypothetical protein
MTRLRSPNSAEEKRGQEESNKEKSYQEEGS